MGSSAVILITRNTRRLITATTTNNRHIRDPGLAKWDSGGLAKWDSGSLETGDGLRYPVEYIVQKTSWSVGVYDHGTKKEVGPGHQFRGDRPLPRTGVLCSMLSTSHRGTVKNCCAAFLRYDLSLGSSDSTPTNYPGAAATPGTALVRQKGHSGTDTGAAAQPLVSTVQTSTACKSRPGYALRISLALTKC
ncbi:hypothetical protein PG991_014066 [Apiospora marii]|uniref:Uncharacterized protein n=1 Tax=Apiospora marii TaxID=335849 RepID=A0ABR1R9R5_9PEZI